MCKISNKIISLFLVFTLFFGVAFSQTEDKTITGIVIDNQTGQPIRGITVSLTDAAVTTDENGKFEIGVPDNQITITISGLDYLQKEIPLKGKETVTVKLDKQLQKSIYNSVKLIDEEKSAYQILNSVSTVQSNLTETSTSPEGLMAGSLTGLRAISRSGAPGIGANLFLRGYSTLYAMGQPLIVVDGMIYDNKEYYSSMIEGNFSNPLSNIDVKDIESITVIKDGNATYGSKAANGVILINTLHTKSATTRIDFCSHLGVKYAPDNIPVLEADEFRSYLTGQLSSSGVSLTEIQNESYMIDDVNNDDYYPTHNNTNWQDEIYDKNIEQSYYMRVTGGDQIAKYNLSVGYLNSKGVIRETGYSRYNTRFNADVNITSKFRMNTNIAFTYGERTLREVGDEDRTSLVYLGLVKSPLFASNVINEEGETTPNLESVDALNFSNPEVLIQNMTGDVLNYRFFGSINAVYDITDKLHIATLFGMTFDKKRENIFIPSEGVVAEELATDEGDNSAANIVDRLYCLYNDTRINYSKVFNHRHGLSAFAGFRYQTNESESDWGEAYNTASDDVVTLGDGSDLLNSTGGGLADWKWLSIYAGAEYNFLKRYLFSASISLDGSSRFGSKADGIDLLSKRFGVFPSVSAAWLVSSEKFMSSADFIDLLKFRVSYAIAGNDDIGNYGDTKYYTSQRFIGVVGTVKGNISNPYIQWETVKKLNAGVDLALFSERVILNADIYKNKTEDMLALESAPYISGYDYFLKNAGEMETKGFDLGVNVRVINSFITWDVGFGLSKYTSEITSLPEDNISEVADGYVLSQVGQAVGVFYGYHTDGVYSSDAEAEESGLLNKLETGEAVSFRGGDVRFIDYDGNDTIDSDDMQVIGNPNPDFIGSFTSTLSWKGLSLSVLVTMTRGNDVYNQLRSKLESMTGYENQTINVLNRWRYDGQVTDVPRAEYEDPMGNSRFSDRWIEDGSYIRLKKITLSYNLPVKSGFLHNAMIYVTGNNLLTSTDYLGYDPEFSYLDGCTTQGIDVGLTPMTKSVFFGVKFGL